MWNVTNNSLTGILERYQTIIDSFFLQLIDISKIKDKQLNLEEEGYLSDIFDKHDILQSQLLNIDKSANDKILPLVKEIILLDSGILEIEYSKYQEQNEQVNKGNFNLEELEHPTSIAKLFKDYFYEVFFGNEWIWNELVGTEFTRTMFKHNFKTENKLNICPYCDIDSISISRNSWIEHFLPKSKFPYLSFNPNNLLPSCTACNVPGTGKGEDVRIPIVSPYNIQIGDNIEFEIDGNNLNILHNDDEAIENYIALLRLRRKYQEDSVKNSIISILKTNYNIFLRINRRGEFDRDLFFDYIHDIGREKGFYFVQKDILKYIDENI